MTAWAHAVHGMIYSQVRPFPHDPPSASPTLIIILRRLQLWRTMMRITVYPPTAGSRWLALLPLPAERCRTKGLTMLGRARKEPWMADRTPATNPLKRPHRPNTSFPSFTELRGEQSGTYHERYRKMSHTRNTPVNKRDS